MYTEFPATLSRYTQIVSSLCNWRRDWFPKDVLHSDIVFWNKERNEFIQIQNGVLGSASKNMTVLLTLSTLVTCRKKCENTCWKRLIILANTQLSTCLFLLDRPLWNSLKIKEKGANPFGWDIASVDLTGRGAVWGRVGPWLRSENLHPPYYWDLGTQSKPQVGTPNQQNCWG